MIRISYLICGVSFVGMVVSLLMYRHVQEQVGSAVNAHCVWQQQQLAKRKKERQPVLVSTTKSVTKPIIKSVPKSATRSWPLSSTLLKKEPNKLFLWPMKRHHFWLSSYYGPRKRGKKKSRFHQGIDMASMKGTVVYAAAGGRVTHARHVAGYGNMVHITHDSLYGTRYAHLDTIAVKENQWVHKGQKIGTVGDTGFTVKKGSDASHLHFEIHEQGKQINPLSRLPIS